MATDKRARRICTLRQFEVDTGISDAAIRALIKRGKLLKNRHYMQRQRRGRIMLDYDEMIGYFREQVYPFT
jgi:hypothetical protein